MGCEQAASGTCANVTLELSCTTSCVLQFIDKIYVSADDHATELDCMCFKFSL